ncbi:translocation protein TolB [Symmachiella dynata]|uniref:WD40 repeat domain-containing protein n=1 Tax=Symmachiella dynata TaxID=2527995 RepID=UPI001189284C|nr:WD40 repeat domain-containing protein [Symmachiella dynata]QDT49024.1 translocation protein TolB [Symmachiella dynata]
MSLSIPVNGLVAALLLTTAVSPLYAAQEQSANGTSESPPFQIGVFSGHTQPVWDLCFTPDGQRLVSAAADNTVRVWDVAGGQQLHQLAGHTDVVRCVAVSPDGKLAASGSTDKTVRFWDLQSGTALPIVLQHPGTVQSLAFAPNGQSLATGATDRKIRLWNVKTGNKIREIDGHEETVSEIVFSPDGKTLVAREGTPLLDSSSRKTGSKLLRMWTVETGQLIKVLEGHEAPPVGLSFSADGKVLSTIDMVNTYIQWNSQGELVQKDEVGVIGITAACDFVPGTKYVVKADSHRAKLLKVEQKLLTRTFLGHSKEIHAVAVAPDGRSFASAGDDHDIRLWDLPNVSHVEKLVDYWKYARIAPTEEPERDRYYLSLREDMSLFPAVEGQTEAEQVQWKTVRLNQNNTNFDALRFKSPLDVPADLYCAIVNNNTFHRLGLISEQGDEKDLGGSKIVSHVKLAGVQLEENGTVGFDSLEGGRIQPGQEYLMWFVFNAKKSYQVPLPVDLQLILFFAPSGTHPPAKSAEDLARVLGIKTPFERNLIICRCADDQVGTPPPAKIDVVDAFRAVFQNTNGWIDIPETLDGHAVAFEAANAKQTSNPAEVHLHVKESGLLMLAASWEHSPSPKHPLFSKRTTREHLIKRYWQPLGSVTRRLDNGQLSRHELFRRYVEAGEELRFFTQTTSRPFVIVPRSWAVEQIINQLPPTVTLPTDESAINMALTPDGSMVAIVDSKNQIHLHEINTGRELATFVGSSGHPWLSISPDGRFLAARGTAATEVFLWNIPQRRLHAQIEDINFMADDAAFSPDSQSLAIIDRYDHAEKSQIILWDVETKSRRKVLKSEDFLEKALSFSPDGKFLAVIGVQVVEGYSFGHQVRLLDIATEKVVHTWSSWKRRMFGRTFSPDNQTLAISEFNGVHPLQTRYRVRLVNYHTGEGLGYLDGHTRKITAMRFTPDGSQLITAGADSTIRVWDIKTQTLKAVQLMGPVFYGNDSRRNMRGQLTISADGTRFATIAYQPTVWRLDSFATDNRQEERDRHGDYQSSIIDLAFTSDSKSLVVASASNSWETEFDTQDWQPREETTYRRNVKPDAVSSDGKRFAAIGDGILLYNASNGKTIKTLGQGIRPQGSVTFSQDGNLVAACYRDDLVRVWDVNSGLLIATAKLSKPYHAALSQDGRQLATSGRDDRSGIVQIWDLSDRPRPATQPLKLLATLEQGHRVRSLRFSPDGKWLATGDDNDRLKVWDLATQSVAHELKGCAGYFSPNGNKLATICCRKDAQTIVIWDLNQGTKLHECTGGHLAAVTTVTFSPDGTRLATGGRGGQVTLWDVASGKQSWTPLQTK